jgi:DNA-binding MarR family transcriptional regulator
MNEQTDWDLRLGYLIHDVSRLRRMMFDRALAPLGITRSQWWLLAFVSRKDGLPQTQLANELDVGKVALGALIDRLEAAGYVTRVPDPQDRRVKRVFLTKQANKFLQELRKETDKFNTTILTGIDRRNLEKTSDTLLAMKKNLVALSDDSYNSIENDEFVGSGKRKPATKRQPRGPRITVDRAIAAEGNVAAMPHQQGSRRPASRSIPRKAGPRAPISRSQPR